MALLACLRGGHPVVLTDAGGPQPEGLVAAYDPDVVLSGAGDSVAVEERRPGSAHDLHPELALLLSTSGSTGSPKLVRLSADNLASNAAAIAAALRIRPRTRGHDAAAALLLRPLGPHQPPHRRRLRSR